MILGTSYAPLLHDEKPAECQGRSHEHHDEGLSNCLGGRPRGLSYLPDTRSAGSACPGVTAIRPGSLPIGHGPGNRRGPVVR